eukprot:gnl/TRDRNA2_/TRDRNA2_167029_c1_seq1.p1 gnl/TRDRNA2_/TRDRNA2_167029_c1~~gnl/TRDRNA2_/TRDRNA2_167029_c1_seq1.p1  ORF type:complete len:108 (+),score=24.54 gnl/TRDRNA2_/TRDRNA2_167029_c1_seq1:2-325(+)
MMMQQQMAMYQPQMALPVTAAAGGGPATPLVIPQGRRSGKLKLFLPDKGYGFITNDDGSKDLFLHQRELANGDQNDLVAGIRLEYEVEEESRSGKLKAVNVKILKDT